MAGFLLFFTIAVIVAVIVVVIVVIPFARIDSVQDGAENVGPHTLEPGDGAFDHISRCIMGKNHEGHAVY